MNRYDDAGHESFDFYGVVAPNTKDPATVRIWQNKPEESPDPFGYRFRSRLCSWEGGLMNNLAKNKLAISLAILAFVSYSERAIAQSGLHILVKMA
ncbi:MAG: hypothetical protein KC777_24335, partial [Cyanobacteria bacterium HKST-UBA02]|nr:hypothetical protein [Cyanobacteria bacterium HKST-UBA02]